MSLIVERCGATVFRSRALVSSVQFWLLYLRGHAEKLIAALKGNPGLLTTDLRMANPDEVLLWHSVEQATPQRARKEVHLPCEASC
jgi:mTERF domain-containing protein